MSEKYDLLHMRGGRKVGKPPVCSAEIARRYMRKEKFTKRGLAWTPPAVENGDRRLLAWSLVDELLGQPAPIAERAEPFLRDATYRWIVSSCRSRDSMQAYARRFRAWVIATGKRSLSMQVNASPDDISDFLFALEADGKAQRTIVHHRDVLRSWFRWLYDRDYIHRSPITRDLLRGWRVDHQAVRKANGQRQSLSLAEATQVARWCLTTAAPEAGLSVLLEMVGGLRSDEIARLERRHIVERDGIATLTVVGKGNKSRQIVLEPIIVSAWHRYLRRRRRQGERGPLLYRPGGGHYDRRQVQRWAKQAAAVVGRIVDISSHDLRKTAITLLREAHADPLAVQAYAGHSDVRLTERCYVTRRPPMDQTTGVAVEPSISPGFSANHGRARQGHSPASTAKFPQPVPRPRIARNSPPLTGPPAPPGHGEGGALGNPEALSGRKFPKMDQGGQPDTVLPPVAGGAAW